MVQVALSRRDQTRWFGKQGRLSPPHYGLGLVSVVAVCVGESLRDGHGSGITEAEFIGNIVIGRAHRACSPTRVLVRATVISGVSIPIEHMSNSSKRMVRPCARKIVLRSNIAWRFAWYIRALRRLSPKHHRFERPYRFETAFSIAVWNQCVRRNLRQVVTLINCLER